MRYEQDLLQQLLNYSGFPEPFIRASDRYFRHAKALGGIPVIQLTQEPKVVKRSKGNIYRISAS